MVRLPSARRARLKVVPGGNHKVVTAERLVRRPFGIQVIPLNDA